MVNSAPVETVDLSAKTVLVVGANVGIGLEASKHFARMQPARLIIACRSESKGRAALAEIEQETGYRECMLWIIDLANFASVVAFADKFEKEGGDLHILVMNAGILQRIYQPTVDGWESTLQVNHLATSLLSLLLIPRLVATGRKSSTPSRMVIVSSNVHHWINLAEEVNASVKPLETLSSKEWCTPEDMRLRRFESKLFNVFFVRALADRLQSTTPLTPVAGNLGYCYSQFRRSFYEFPRFSLVRIMVAIQERLLAWTPEQGSRQLVFAAATFKGTVMHSSEFTSAAEHIGKTALLIGACSSGHDIAQDFFNHGIDVTMYQRSSTFVVTAKSLAAMLSPYYGEGFPTELADIYNISLPHAAVRRVYQRAVPAIAETVDKDILDGLAKVGFKTNHGLHGTGILPLFFERGGGHYVDTGTSQHIINGDIKIKNGSAIKSFTENGISFADGTELQADIIIFATVSGGHLDSMREICGDEVASKVGPVWGMDEEGQLQGVFRHSGHDGLWFGMGNLAISRFHSIHLAMQIKAIEEGILNKAAIVI